MTRSYLVLGTVEGKPWYNLGTGPTDRSMYNVQLSNVMQTLVLGTWYLLFGTWYANKPWYRTDRQGAKGALAGSTVTPQIVPCSNKQINKGGHFKTIMDENTNQIHFPYSLSLIILRT